MPFDSKGDTALELFERMHHTSRRIAEEADNCQAQMADLARTTEAFLKALRQSMSDDLLEVEA